MNFGKSLMLWSCNIPTLEVDRLSACVGVFLTKSFGKYLGHHTICRGKEQTWSQRTS